MAQNLFELKITAFAFGGDGMAALPDGKMCFVPGGVPGDVVSAEIVQDKKNFARARIAEILEKSPDRIEPFCPLRKSEPSCPSCVYAEVPYSVELAWKQKQFEGFINRAKLPEKCRILPPFASPVRTGYRNKITLSCENGVAGYRAADNRTLVPVSACPLARKAVNELLARTEIPEKDGRLLLRWTLADGAFPLANPEQSSGGRPKERMLTEQLPGYGKFLVPRTSFFQVNVAVGAELASRVISYVRTFAPAQLMELFCGVGVFSILAAESLESLRTCGIELDRDAILAASLNAKHRGLAGRCAFFSGRAENFDEFPHGDPDGTMLLADPPRTGLEEGLLAKILDFRPSRILYIACAPDMLRRDLERLSSGYRAVESALLDMFPSTAHFETVTLLERR